MNKNLSLKEPRGDLSPQHPREDLSPSPPSESPSPKRPWAHVLRHVGYVAEQLVKVLLGTLYLYGVAALHHPVEKYLLHLPGGMLKECLGLLCNLFLLSSFIGVLPLIGADAREAIKRLLDLFK